MRNEIKYCVNYRGQKIKPYTSVVHPYNKKVDWDSIVSYAIVFCVGILAITSTTIMLIQLLG